MESPTTKGKHLTRDQRACIETLLDQGFSVRHIARSLGKSPSTIQREIRNHTQIRKTRVNDCQLKRDCHKRSVCGSASCRKNCRTCNYCMKRCTDYVKTYCDTLESGVGLCNGCLKAKYCGLDKKFYKASEAHAKYTASLSDSRAGFDLTAEDLITINELVSPLIKQGQSPYAIKINLGDRLSICENTLRRLIDSCELDVRNIDLRDKVKRRQRRHSTNNNYHTMKVIKDGHKYEDYLKFIEENDVSVWQMDCVEGTKEDAGAILTLHSPEFHLQLLFILKEHTSKCVVDMLDTLEFALGYDIYSHVFEVILTDNGHEFSDLAGMETSIAGGIRRSRVFYCEPNRSDQKGACEENHKMVRYVIPKGTSIDKYMQWDMTLLTNHLNSYPRRSLYGKCPYEVAMRYLPEDFFILIGLERIAAEKVLLQPSLLHHPQD